MAFDLTQLKDIPIVDILRDIYGIEAHKNGERYYCKIRPERTGSCCIYPTNTFYDFGSGAGGDTITLVAEMESCDKKTAIEKLAEWYNINPQNRKRNGNMLWEHEWKKLGIEPDMVSKNLNINIIASDADRPDSKADINLYLQNSAQLTAFYEKYYVSMNEFRASDKVGYHTFLKRHILPELFNIRDDYYANLLSEYTLCCEIGGENFAYNAVISDLEINETAKEINEQSHLLRRAVDDISLLKTPLLNLNPEQDLKDIIDGKTAVKLSKKSYFDLCKYAKSKGEQLVVFQLSKADYTHEYMSGGDQIHHLAHSCYYKNNVCHLTTFGKNLQAFEQIFGAEIRKTVKVNDVFKSLQSEKNRQANSRDITVKI